MTLHLHTPSSKAHVEELAARLTDHLRRTPADPWNPVLRSAQVRTLCEVVRAMDRGVISPDLAVRLFDGFRIDGFSFARWLDEMRDEGVYVDLPHRHAA